MFVVIYMPIKLKISVYLYSGPGFIQTDFHHCERHRPERFTDTSDPFYTSEVNKMLNRFLSISIQTGMPIDEIGFRLFKAIEDNQMCM